MTKLSAPAPIDTAVPVPAGQADRTGAQLLVDSLRLHGADMAFGVPGESYLAVLDAIFATDGALRFVVCRQEGGAAFMADAYGKLTGRPGLCFVTRGPGACNASIGLHAAFQDSTPLILFIGQVGSDVVDREAFQEIDYRRMFGPMAKWVAQIDRADRVPEYVGRAFHTAVAGRPGPVVLALPEDMQTVAAPPAPARPFRRVAAHPGADDMRRLGELIAAAERPLVVLGGSGWTAEACGDMAAFLSAFDLPAVSSFRRQDLLDNADPHYVGDLGVGRNPRLVERVRGSDLLLVVGSRLGELASAGYTLLDIPQPRQTLVHIHPGAEELGKVYQGELLINAGMPEFAAAVRALPAPPAPAWAAWRHGAREAFEAWQRPLPQPGRLNMTEVMAHLADRLPPKTVVTNGAGNYAVWVHRFHRYRGFRTQLASTSGAMGYGVPAAIAAQLVRPGQPVVAFAGDGCFLMNGQELATAALYDLRIVFLVVNNGMYGTIRMHQEREYPRRISGTMLRNPDFAALAAAYGLHGETVETTVDFAPAFERAWNAGRSALIELRVDPEAITPTTTIETLRNARPAA